MKHRLVLTSIALVAALLVMSNNAGAQGLRGAVQTIGTGTAFTYQGRLGGGGAPFNGSCDMAFRLYDQVSNGSQIATTITTTVPIDDGLFSIPLDFGSAAFNGEARFLDIRVKCGSDTGFTVLNPRQELTPAPYALYAVNNVPLAGGTMTGDLTTTRLLAGSPASSVCNGLGDVCAEDDVVADDDITQARTGDGTVKAGVYLYCSNSGSYITRSFNNVNGVTITVSDGDTLGKCTVDFGFQVDDRYIIATVSHPDAPLGVTVSTTSSGELINLFVWHGGNGAAVGGGAVWLIVY